MLQVKTDLLFICSKCGAPLKAEVDSGYHRHSHRGEKAEKNEKQEKNEKDEPEKNEKQEKNENGFIGWLFGGLILIVIGVLSILQFSNMIPSGTMGPIMLLIIGGLVILAAVYYMYSAKKRTLAT